MEFVVTIEFLNAEYANRENLNREDRSRQITVAQDELLLNALLSRGVRFAYSCQSGNCGACKCQLISGRVRQLPFSNEALSQTEREQGLILACRAAVMVSSPV